MIYSNTLIWQNFKCTKWCIHWCTYTDIYKAYYEIKRHYDTEVYRLFLQWSLLLFITYTPTFNKHLYAVNGDGVSRPLQILCTTVSLCIFVFKRIMFCFMYKSHFLITGLPISIGLLFITWKQQLGFDTFAVSLQSI